MVESLNYQIAQTDQESMYSDFLSQGKAFTKYRDVAYLIFERRTEPRILETRGVAQPIRKKEKPTAPMQNHE